MQPNPQSPDELIAKDLINLQSFFLNSRAATHNYFHYQLICQLFLIYISVRWFLVKYVLHSSPEQIVTA